ncbi:hypothetical protein MKW98_021094 [Papaver atlanticum]|uniref:F-box domain-containing protein n=1 Tax=Papaver atlanticum TaxID=357466 RepID=A0AAD4T7A5_9MAGN|nr:hypothetical protein MKW98_021094 [Papaver atlanticum]
MTNKKSICSSVVDSEKKSKSCVCFDEDIVCDIPSRLPVKSLLRLKCVSKRWYSLIQDPYFVDLHLIRSKARQRLFVAEPLYGERRNSPSSIYLSSLSVRFVIADIFFKGRGTTDIIDSAVYAMKNTIKFSYEDILEL